MSDEPAMSDEQIETMAWELETKMMAIRKDPRAALADGLAKARATMLAKYKADLETKMAEAEAQRETKLAEAEARLETELAKRVANLNALFAAELEKRVAKLDAMFAAEEVKAKAELAALTSDIRAAHVDLDGLRADDETAEPDPPQPLQ
jgi:F0F1-type ATP synthase membrane subunit b/b'